MKVDYRKLNESDLDIFIQMRINQLQEEGTTSTEDLTLPLRNYYQRHILDNTFISWVATDNGKIIATSGMSFVERPPTYGCPSGKIGILSSMYTLKKYRQNGIATMLLDKVMLEAKDHGCGAVHVTGSDMGVLLYTNYGFKKNKNFMHYSLVD